MNPRTDRINADADATTARKALLHTLAAKADALGSTLRRTGVADLDEQRVRDLLADVDAVGNGLATLLPLEAEDVVEPVFHTGGSPDDETPALLHRGEGVISQAAAAALADPAGLNEGAKPKRARRP